MNILKRVKHTEKLQRRIRNLIIILTIICLTPLCEKSRVLSGAHSTNAYAGKELLCVIELENERFGAHGLDADFNYRLINEFAAANHCYATIITANREDNYLDSLRHGKADLVITYRDSLQGLGILSDIDSRTSWVINGAQPQQFRQLNSWIAHMRASGRINDLRNTFRKQNLHKMAENGIKSSNISPYDHIIRKHAKTLGWDWRMVAAVVYQESGFSISSRSPRGAQGLMQVMPQTGAYYGISDLLDPEQNIIAGVSHLKRLQKMFSKYEMAQEELVRFTLAAYNAGEGRIIDCRNLAESQGLDCNSWSEVVKVIPSMREDSILENENVRLGKFYGYETINYIENVTSHYEAICQICPTSL